MKSRKKLLCLAVAASLVMGVAFAGCTTTDNEADAKRTIAVVNISKTEAFEKEFGEDYKAAVIDKVYLKRDMMTAYYNGYYDGNVSYGQSNAAIFDSIKDSLVSSAVTTQYATVYLLKSAVDDKNKSATLSAYYECGTEAEKYEYILNQYDENAVARVEYSLKSTLNSVLDSAERRYIKDKEDDDEYSGSDTHSTPSGINATVDEYIPENYNVYTGYEGYLLPEGYDRDNVKPGDYKALYGSTRVTRQKAYSRFLGNLRDNYLLTEEDDKITDNDIWKLSYVQESYVSQLQSEIISEYQDKIKEDKEEKIQNIENDVYTYVKDQYDSLLDKQSKEYDSNSTFESAMGSLSDTKFILYSPSTKQGEDDAENRTFGYVYNILLPFSTLQSQQLTTLQSYRDNEIYTESEYFYERNKLLKNIVTTDQRAAWFNGTTDYSFKASETELDYYGKDDGRDYLFFENNLTDTAQYKPLEKYDGRYSYNGTVKENTNGSYTLIPNKLTIDGMLSEFSAYIDYVLTGENKVTYTVAPDAENYYGIKDFTKEGEDKEIDYSKLVYAMGNVDLGANANRENMFDATTDRYKAMAAVNELQYAYTTDTGVLSQYIGYTVSAYDTSYIKEFEYAAQQAVKGGAGTFAVCAGDYGWHLIYVTETFDAVGGAAYNVDFSTERVEKEGTFENRFYNWIKDSHLAKEVTLKNNKVLKEYNTDKAIKVYKDAYKDLGE